MKKVLTVFVCLVLFVLLFACREPAAVSVFSCERDGATDTLSLNGTDGTFTLKEGESETSGTYVFQNGYYILTSEAFGQKTVRVIADNFAFIDNPTEDGTSAETTCSHRWDDGAHTDGNCKTYGYTVFTCALCSETKTVTDEKYGDHSYPEKGTHISGTCSVYGKTTYQCTLCGSVKTVTDTEYNTEVHNPSLDFLEYDNGCKKVTSLLYTCSDCGKTVTEPSDHIGAHTFVSGVCTECGRAENGFSQRVTDHADNNKDGLCDRCGISTDVIADYALKGYSLQGTKLFVGATPTNHASDVTVEELKEKALYDASTDCYYLNGEAYKICSSAVTENRKFLDGTEAVRNCEYVFSVTPISWTAYRSDGLGTYYLCDYITDGKRFVDDVYLTKEGKNISGADGNSWEDSSLYAYLNGTFLQTVFSAQQRSLFFNSEAGIGLATKEEFLTLSAEARTKTVTDYALNTGLNFTDEEGLPRTARWYLSSPGEDGTVYYVDLDCLATGAVNRKMGVVPVLYIKKNQ